MSDFWQGFIIASAVFFFPRLLLGQFTVYTKQRGWVLRFETSLEADRNEVDAFLNKERHHATD